MSEENPILQEQVADEVPEEVPEDTTDIEIDPEVSSFDAIEAIVDKFGAEDREEEAEEPPPAAEEALEAQEEPPDDLSPSTEEAPAEEPQKDQFDSRLEFLQQQERRLQADRESLQAEKESLKEFERYKEFARLAKQGDAGAALEVLDMDPVEFIDAVADARPVKPGPRNRETAELRDLREKVQELEKSQEKARQLQAQVEDRQWTEEIETAINSAPDDLKSIWNAKIFEGRKIQMIKDYQRKVFEETGKVPDYKVVFDTLTPQLDSYLNTLVTDPLVQARLRKQVPSEPPVSESKPSSTRARTPSRRKAPKPVSVAPDLEREEAIDAIIKAHG
jgi:hypothetical protein